MTKTYPWYTPYQFAGNSPIENIDVDGLEESPAGKLTVNDVLNNPKIDILDPGDKLFDSPVVSLVGKNLVEFGAALYAAKATQALQNEEDFWKFSAYMMSAQMLQDFAIGRGRTETEFSEHSPFTTLLNRDNRLVRHAINDFNEVLGRTNSDPSIYFHDNDIFRSGYEFSPDHTDTPGESLERHLEALEEPIDLIIGGMSIKITPEFDTKGCVIGLNIEFYNEMSRNSLFVHRATNIYRDDGEDYLNNEVIDSYKDVLSVTKQKFIFDTISIEEFEKITEEIRQEQEAVEQESNGNE